jgi:hypothetical protein
MQSEIKDSEYREWSDPAIASSLQTLQYHCSASLMPYWNSRYEIMELFTMAMALFSFLCWISSSNNRIRIKVEDGQILKSRRIIRRIASNLRLSRRGWNPRSRNYMDFCMINRHRWKFDHEWVRSAPSHTVDDKALLTSQFVYDMLQNRSLLLRERRSLETPGGEVERAEQNKCHFADIGEWGWRDIQQLWKFWKLSNCRASLATL